MAEHNRPILEHNPPMPSSEASRSIGRGFCTLVLFVVIGKNSNFFYLTCNTEVCCSFKTCCSL